MLYTNYSIIDEQNQYIKKQESGEFIPPLKWSGLVRLSQMFWLFRINSSSVFKSKLLFSALGDSFSSGFNSGVIGVVGCTGIVGCVGNTGILCYTIISIINFSIRLSR